MVSVHDMNISPCDTFVHDRSHLLDICCQSNIPFLASTISYQDLSLLILDDPWICNFISHGGYFAHTHSACGWYHEGLGKDGDGQEHTVEVEPCLSLRWDVKGAELTEMEKLFI